MCFEGLYGTEGKGITYRDGWVIALGTFAAFMIATSAVVSVVCYKYGGWKTPETNAGSKKKFRYIGSAVSFVYLAVLVGLGIANGLIVFGGVSIAVTIGILIGIQAIVAVLGVLLGAPCLADMIVSSSNWVIAGCLWFLIQLPSMFDYVAPKYVWLISIAASIPLVLKAGVTYCKIVRSRSMPNRSFRDQFYLSIRQAWFYVTLLLVLAAGIIFVFFFAGTCISVFDPNVPGSWVSFDATLRWNSRMMRSLSPSPCPGPGPCHVYLTLGSDVTSQVFINVHLPQGSASFLTVNVNNGEHILNATTYDTPLLDSHDDRLVYSVYVAGLAPGANHSFTLTSDQGSLGQELYEFQTTPLDTVRFVTGGDSGTTTYAEQIFAQMIATNPHFAVFGGDIAYDNGMLSCACVWDHWLSLWESHKVDDRFMVPLVFAAGNHDLGVDDIENGAKSAFSKQTSECDDTKIGYAKPLYFAWFPFDTTTGNLPAPVCDRTTMHLYTVGDMMNLWSLDTAYAVSTQDNVDFVNSNMPSTGVNVGVYHVPLYSSRISGYPYGVYLQDAWATSIFDEFNFAACFENHAHTYKRTNRLINNTAVDESNPLGTAYMGDGHVGAPRASESSVFTDDPMFAVTGTQYHFFAVSMNTSANVVHADAIDESGVIFDQYTQPTQFVGPR